MAIGTGYDPFDPVNWQDPSRDESSEDAPPLDIETLIEFLGWQYHGRVAVVVHPGQADEHFMIRGNGALRVFDTEGRAIDPETTWAFRQRKGVEQGEPGKEMTPETRGAPLQDQSVGSVQTTYPIRDGILLGTRPLDDLLRAAIEKTDEQIARAFYGMSVCATDTLQVNEIVMTCGRNMIRLNLNTGTLTSVAYDAMIKRTKPEKRNQ